MRFPLICRRLASTYGGLTSEQFMKNPLNEPVLKYLKGSEERKALEAELDILSQNDVQVPLPFNHSNTIAHFNYATAEDIEEAIKCGMGAREAWERKSLKERADIFLHAADLCAGKYRMRLNAATMLGQAKNIQQAEIDSACELVDFLRFNAYFAFEVASYQPISTKIYSDSLIYRGLEGFVAAIAPFNFTAIGGNLATAPALMGNVVLWKPSDTAVLSNFIAFEALLEAGIPPGVISFLPSDGPTFGNTICSNRHLAGINFTGSMPTFLYLYNSVAKNMGKYVTFPRLVGECGGKNFHFVHPSANINIVVPCTLRAAYEYQGQKCSACSRFFVPQSLWPKIKEGLINLASQVKMDDVRDGSVFMSAVIDDKAFKRIKSYIDFAKNGNDGMEIIFGGKCDDTKGYFVQPTIIEVKNVNSKLLTEEIFGPVLAVYVYPDGEELKYLKSLKNSTPYGLTGAVFGEDKQFLEIAKDVLRDAVGNLYLNDKCTGAVVGQQPFGGARQSGTNDKAGGLHYLLRWTSPQTIKETTSPQTEWRYPNMD
ncbi:unnamed protein product [Meloidogyne enterolobii]|uniref:Uncharacterized protein n=1 Tax=Meloidogyne enterolobii TaxID=390850 RepID=A0ACB0Z8E6_MELEN